MRLIAVALLAVVGALFLPASANAAARHQVMIMNFTLSPVALTVRAGDTVTWTNHDEAPHDVASSSGPAVFRSPLLEKGQSWTQTFTAPGNYGYFCSVHPDMRAQIVVLAVETPTQAPVQRQPVTQRPAITTTTTTVAAAQPGPVERQPEQPVPAQEAVAAQVVGQRLDPMLIVAGIVGAVAVLCLLLIGARPEP